MKVNDNNKKFPYVSIITPNYNMGDFLENTIASVLSQNYPNIRYIIIDGGSSDNSLEVINKYNKYLYYWVSESDRGQSHAINKGFLQADGEIIGWINSDDILAEEAVSKVVENFLKFPDIDVIYGKVERIDSSGNRINTPILPKDLIEFNKENIIDESIVNQPGLFFRSLWIDKVGLLDEELQYSMDYDYWVRLVLAGAKFMRLKTTLAYFRLSTKSKTVNQTIDMTFEHLNVLNSILTMKDLDRLIGLPKNEIDRRVKKTKAILYLYVFNGYMKIGEKKEAKKWIVEALKMSPTVVLQKRWLGLALAKIRR
jgi:glycosyltransferase involved in cell wall biosynthesis